MVILIQLLCFQALNSSQWGLRVAVALPKSSQNIRYRLRSGDLVVKSHRKKASYSRKLPIPDRFYVVALYDKLKLNQDELHLEKCEILGSKIACYK